MAESLADSQVSETLAYEFHVKLNTHNLSTERTKQKTIKSNVEVGNILLYRQKEIENSLGIWC